MHNFLKHNLTFLSLILIPLFSHADLRVENGDDVMAKDNLSRSVARLSLSKGATCSATFLTKKILLTAGHCTSATHASTTVVKVRDASGKWHSAKVAQVYTHPDFFVDDSLPGTRVKHDIGVVELSEEFPFAVRPLKIGSIAKMTKTEAVTIVGYGMSAETGGSGTLRQGTMDGTIKALNAFFGRKGIYLENTHGQLGCPGDSGGAVLRGDSSSSIIIGVNSLSSGCKGYDQANSMSEIADHHKDWIQSVAPDVL